MEISYNGKIYSIERLNLETDQQLITRSWWIMHNISSNDNYEELVLLSKYWHNIFFKKCGYSKEIMDRISLDLKFC